MSANMEMDLDFGGRWFPLPTTLIPDTTAQAVMTILVPFNISTLTVSLIVAVAALTGLELWAKGDESVAFISLPMSSLLVAGRSDAGTDVNVTPVGQTAVLCIDCSLWTVLELRATSAGAAQITAVVRGR